MIERDPRGRKTLASFTEFLALVGRGIGLWNVRTIGPLGAGGCDDRAA